MQEKDSISNIQQNNPAQESLFQEYDTQEKDSPIKKMQVKISDLFWIVLLIAVLFTGAYFRTLGMDWDDNEYLHPDERFMSYVVSAIHQNQEGVSFFDTENSTMNPDNVGYNWYVYGTLPLFTNRIVSDFLNENGLDIEWIGISATGWEMHLVGRYLSAIYDTITIFLTFLIGLRLFKKLWPAVIAAGFYAFFALPIQLSHYFTVDIMANMFCMAAFYIAVLIMTHESKPIDNEQNMAGSEASSPIMVKWDGIIYYILFGVFSGFALACKISAAPIVLLLPLAGIVNMMRTKNKEEWQQLHLGVFIRNLIIGGIVFFVFFRIGQPYAFEGPTFFHIIPNKDWISDLQSLSGQSKGLVDFPPALQWSRRPIWFGFENLTLWGVGLPLGIIAWLAYLWQTFEMARGKWKEHLVTWSLTTMFFVWQSVNFTSSMRYYMQIYVPLALTAAWGGFHLFTLLKRKRKTLTWVPVFLITVAFLGTLGYGYAFSQIYSRPATRVEASDWYFQNIPAPINVKIDTSQGEMQQVFGYKAGQTINFDESELVQFTAQKTAIITKVAFDHIREDLVAQAGNIGISVTFSSDPDGMEMFGYGELYGEFGWNNHQFGDPYDVVLTEPAHLVQGETYYLHVKVLSPGTYVQLTGVAVLHLMTWDEGDVGMQILPEFVDSITATEPNAYSIDPKWTGEITRIEIPHILDLTGDQNIKNLTVRLSEMNNLSNSMEVTISNVFAAETDVRGEAYVFEFEEPFAVEQGEMVRMEFLLEGESGVAFFGTKQANESSWDDVVPLRRSNYDPFSAYMGEYRSELNFEMYWADNEDKRERFLSIIEQADLIMITSSRQWGTTTRVPERYPMTSMYYRELIGCPEDKDIFWCYAVAETGMFEGNLGFRLKEVFQSNPNIGDFEINDQFAEEAFKVYDHPKVLVFEKTEDYDREAVRELFNSVDLSQVIYMIPADVPLRIVEQEETLSLMLPEERWEMQQEQGTWSELYNLKSLINQSELLAVVVFYLLITVLGLIMYPLTRVVFSGLQAKGYAVSRMFGLLLFAWLSWLIGSAGVPLTQTMVWIVFISLVALNGIIFFYNREAILNDLKENGKKILIIEVVGLAFFLAFLLVRLGNPDLWHPYKGGEKPMDFSYLNAVLKSTTFPPYDPWFAGGYINYYYYGFVIVGMPIKALGINPSVAYNLVLAMLFSLFALVSFSIGTTLFASIFKKQESEKDQSIIGGISVAIMTLVIGNFGTIQMIFEGLVKLGGGNDQMKALESFRAFFSGVSLKLQGNPWTFYPGDWYWIPSRMIPEEPITEFPYFTFLYADLHAHMIAMPITLLVVAWCISLLQNRMRWEGKFSWWKKVVTLLSGAMIVGALRPTNTWDLPVFLVLAVITLAYVLFNNVKYKFTRNRRGINENLVTWFVHILVIVAFVLTIILMYTPFTEWYGEGYNSVKLWEGSRTPLNSYLSHWGIMLALVVVWFAMDTYRLLKNTPVSALNGFNKYQIVVIIGLSLFVILLVGFAIYGVRIHWVAIPVALWAALLMLQKSVPSTKSFLYFLAGTAMFLTIIVEVIVLDGDIGRMNTVFKFYLQAWNLLAIVAGIGLSAFIYSLFNNHFSSTQLATTIVLSVFLMCGLLFPVMATIDKVNDRMASEAPHVLNGMAYMDYAEYNDQGEVYSLTEDAEAMRWMQENVNGTPVIIEGNTPEYRWGTRFTIYTGLPGVVGWNWHQRQQRTYLESNDVQERVNQVTQFYSTTDITEAKELLARYDVEYIIVGQLEELYYPEEGLMKFAQYEGELWSIVYSNIGTTIYRVMDWE